MATQLGNLSIEKVEGKEIHGSFESLYEKNVYNAYPEFGAAVLMELWGKFDHDSHHPFAHELSEAADKYSPDSLSKFIEKVSFDTPHKASTNFVIVVTDTRIASIAQAGASWGSYYLG